MSAEDSDKCEELSNFDKGQIVMARRLGLSAVKTARLVGCSRSVVVTICRQLSEPEKTTKQRARPKDARAKRRKLQLSETDAQESSVPENKPEPPSTKAAENAED